MTTMTATGSVTSTATSSVAALPVERPVLGPRVRRAGARLLGWAHAVDRVFAGAARVRGAEVAARHNPYWNIQPR